MTAVDPRQDEPVEAGFGGSGSAVPLSKRLKGYLALTKPRIIELLLVTTVPTMFLAAGGLPDVRTVIATLIGGS